MPTFTKEDWKRALRLACRVIRHLDPDYQVTKLQLTEIKQPHEVLLVDELLEIIQQEERARAHINKRTHARFQQLDIEDNTDKHIDDT